MQASQPRRGFALITALGILGLFLLVALVILIMTTQNSQNVGNAYTKQGYYDVAEAGVDRGLQDLDSSVPAPGSGGTPGPIPSPPTVNQTPLPNKPGVPYHYAYWYNSTASGVATPDPLAGTFGVSVGHQVQVPANGAVIWSYTTTGNRDVAVETIVSRFATSDASCAVCAGNNVVVTGSNKVSAPPVVCGSSSAPDKICSDPLSSPAPAPSNVPIVAGGSYPAPPPGAGCGVCAYGDGTSTPSPTLIQQNAPGSVTSTFLASQGSIDQLADIAYWQDLAAGSSNVKFKDCTAGCSSNANQWTSLAPGPGQVLFIDGDLSLTQNVLSYSGLIVVLDCLSVSGKAGLQGTGTGAEVIVLGTDAQCGGNAASIQGGGNSNPAAWNGGTLYAAQGSVSVTGNGSVKGYNFYGAIIAAGTVMIGGNGFFAWESALKNATSRLGPFTIDSFAQY